MVQSDRDWSIYEIHEAIALLVCGILLSFIGFAYHPPGLSKWTKRIMWAANGYAIGVLIMMQAALSNLEGKTDIWVMVGVPVLFMIFIAIFYYFGAFFMGYLIVKFLIDFIIRQSVGEVDATFTDPIDSERFRSLLVEVLGLIGGLICFTWLNSNESKARMTPIAYIQSVIGINFIMYFASCQTDLKPYRVFDLDVTLANEKRYCTVNVTTADEMVTPFAICFAVGFGCLIWQNILGKIFSKLGESFTVTDEQDKDEELPTTGKQLVLRELQKIKRSKRFQNSAWYYTRHKGEYVSFKKHDEILDENLTELGLTKRPIPSVEPDPSSQFIAAADQLALLYNQKLTGEDVRREVMEWLRDQDNWDLLANLENDLLGMKAINHKEYCDEMEKTTTWADFITLQGIVQRYNTEINIITSIPEPRVVQFPIIPQSQKQAQKSILRRAQTLRTVKSFSEEQKERYVLIGSDSGKVLVDKFIAEQSSVLSRNMKEAKERGTNKIQFNGNMTSKVLRSIVEQLEAYYLIKHNDRSQEVQEAYKILGLVGKFGDDIGAKQADPPIMLLAHYWGYHFCSLDKGKRKIGPSDLPDEEPQWQVITQGHVRVFVNRILIVLVTLLGFWWLLWLVIWGYNYNSFAEGLEFTLFFIAEFINFALGTIYNMNFWNPIMRRWKSLDHLNPPFQEPVIANVLISHYSEAAADTERTINGSLRIKCTEETTLRIWICDDGFWKYPPPPKAPPSTQQKPTFWSHLKTWFDSTKNLALAAVPAQLQMQMSTPAPVVEKKEEPKKLPEPPKDNNNNQAPKKEEPKKITPIEGFTATFPGEEEIMQECRSRWGVTPKPLGLEMIQMIRRALYRYYSEKTLSRVDVGCDVQLRTEKDIVRADCAKGTLRYTFYAKKFGTDERIPGPEIILAGRIKPDYHHYKAGNHNNIFFNEQMEGEFVYFLDNDMKPKPDSLMRTLPFFYYYHESSGRYEIDRSAGFLQSPQFFKQSTLAGERDHLGGRNSVFFQGIQHGRDGYDLCSFAGTNAIFRLPPLHTVGGVPYGSLTEDAHTAIQLHRYGYKSIYIQDKLAVGTAPVTVANSLQQRGRWCKGSVQLSFLYLFGMTIKDKDKQKWSKPNPFPLDSRRDVQLHSNYNYEQHSTRNIFRRSFLFDTVSWPFSALTAMMYIIVAFIFLIAAKAPIYFLRDKLLYRSFLITFLPYFTFKLIFQYLAYHQINAQDVWVAQEVWFSYAFASVYGIVDALKELITGKGLGGWGVTGEGTRSSNLEYFNVVVVFGLLLCMLIRGVVFLLNADRDPAEAASIFFAVTIVIQMWPVTSTTVFEWINNAHLTVEDKVDLKRYEMPKYLLFAFFIVFTVLIGQLLDVSTSG